MSSPIKSLTAPLTSALGRAFTIPGTNNPAPAVPDVPPPAPPAADPSGKPGKKSQQQSFLSGVAGSSLNQSGAASGKSLLGQ